MLADQGMNPDLYGKLMRAVKDDRSLRDGLTGAPTSQRRDMLRQLKTKTLGSPKNARDKAKDQAKAAFRDKGWCQVHQVGR